jgi:multicomponent Na+:H+ antiporter subunit G
MIFDALAIVALVCGAFFLLVSTVGLLRLPDFLSRAHAVGKSDTLGSLLVLLGLAIHSGFGLDSGKLLLIVVFIAVTNPTGIHTLARAALRTGSEIWVVDPKLKDAREEPWVPEAPSAGGDER